MSNRSSRRAEIERLFALREAEGLSLRELSEHSGIPVGTLGRWSSQLRRSKQSAFQEVHVRDSIAVTAVADQPVALRLRLPSGLVAELDGDLAERVALALLGLEGPSEC